MGGIKEVVEETEEFVGLRERRLNFGLVERAFGCRDRSREGGEQRFVEEQDVCWFHFLSEARKTLRAPSQTTTERRGLEHRVRPPRRGLEHRVRPPRRGEDWSTGRVLKGQRESRDEERRASVAELGCMSEKESVEGRADRTEEAREEDRGNVKGAESVDVGGLSVPESERE